MKDAIGTLIASLVPFVLIGSIWGLVAVGPSFVRWANRHLDAAAPATTCTCPPAPVSPVATPTP